MINKEMNSSRSSLGMTYEQALHRLAAYCSRAERCIWDVRRKMDEWEITAEQQNKIIHQLRKENFLDEERYCKAFVSDKSRYNRWGVHKIRFELRRKRLPEALIGDALKNLDPEENRERLRQLIEKKRKSVKGKNEWEIRQKLLRFAASRGFSQDEIERVL